MESSATHYLPEELILQILLRLPVKSVLRLKSVCKSWFSLISEPHFAKSHFDLAAAPTHRLLVRNSNNPKFQVNFVDTENDYEDSVFNIPDPNPLPKNMVDVVGSCRGFLLLMDSSHNSRFHSHFMIWNPSTGLEKRFNKGLPFSPDLCGLGYDSLTDDYVVVTITLGIPENKGFHCFSSRTNSWSCIEINVGYDFATDYEMDFAQGSFLNGAIHWLVFSLDKEFDVIIAFDAIKRRLSEIPLLHELEFPFPRIPRRYLSILRGCLCLCFDCGSATEIWMMNEYNVKSSWTRMFVFSFSIRSLFPVCLTKNGEILGRYWGGILVRLDNEGEMREHGSYESRYRLLPRGIYRESLLSLPH